MAKRKKKSTGKVIAVIVLVLALSAFALHKVQQSGPKGIEVSLGKSTRADITSTVTATGKVYPEVEVKISSEVAGEVVELPVRDGATVSKGDLLVRVNTDTLEAQLKQQEAALSANKANVAQARAQMLQAELEHQRLQNLLESGFTTLQQVDRSRTEWEVAQANLEASRFRVEQQEMQLKEAADMLAKATTFAPIDGTITALNAELGDRVVGTGQFAGTEILRLANLSNMEVRVDVSESEIVQVKIGDLAEVEIDAIPGHKFKGKVTEIANSAKTNEGGSQEQLTTFQVKVKLEEPDPRYRPGMTATADIQTRTVVQAILVPLQSVTIRQKSEVEKQLNPEKADSDKTADAPATDPAPSEKAGRKGSRKEDKDRLQRVVFLVREGKAVLTPVETGIADNRNMEIISGLDAGETLVIGSYAALTRELRHDVAVREKTEQKGKNKKPQTR
jgi:HlyD family secretion protein